MPQPLRSRPALALSFVLLSASLGAGAAPAETPGASPAATLLLPYFEVDPSDPDAMTTLVSVNNAGSAPIVAHVVLWTDWGIPTYSFDLALEADDVATLNLRDLFDSGSVPVTDGTHVSGCGNPVARPPLGAAALAALRARHAGLPDPESGLCYGSEQPGETTYVGYLTVDAASSCAGEETFFPSDEGYFASAPGGVPAPGFAAFENVLWGDLFYVAAIENSAQGTDLVHIPHDPDAASGETFYRSFTANGEDERAFLGSRYRGRYFEGGAFDGGTDLLVWLEGSTGSEPVACGERESHIDTCQSAEFSLYDEAGELLSTAERSAASLAFRLPVGEAGLEAPAPFGIFELDHYVVSGCVIIPIGTFPMQAWAIPVMKAQGRFSVGLPATRIPVPDGP